MTRPCLLLLALLLSACGQTGALVLPEPPAPAATPAPAGDAETPTKTPEEGPK